ncbi:hypothetical protein B0O99DRAFT_736614 [Bisporella sp. PMI_857]|nr:hypothetical protein B0O99DRAFT_736614 [Bisporella sp. PMI_857]
MSSPEPRAAPVRSSAGRIRKFTGPPDLSTPQPIVTFKVGAGDKQESFAVHKNIVMSQSSFFAAAFQSNFLEGTTQIMDLDDVEPSIFGMVVHWLYFNKIDGGGHLLATTDKLVMRAKVWVLGRRFLMPQLQNYISSGLVSVCVVKIKKGDSEKAGLVEFCHYIYENHCIELQKLAVDCLIDDENRDGFTAIWKDLPTMMHFDLAIAMKSICLTNFAGERALPYHTEEYLVKEEME